jgi:GTP-binding protein EngB required for normal cell division
MGLLDINPGSEETKRLNDAQRLRLRVSCQYVDRLLGEVESILHSATSNSPFSKYVFDVSPAKVRVIEDHIARVRLQLLHSLAWQKIETETPAILASHAILTHLSFIDIAVEELRPRYMRGSGPIEDGVASELNGVVHELRALLEGLTRFVRQQDHLGLEGRLERLRQGGAEVSLLGSIAEVIARYSLVEFRERLEGITARLEDGRFEIAFFGRVSSGKSSLLNALMGAEVLPVGINPITAVPTRLQWGRQPKATLTFADGRRQEIPLEDLACFVTEDQNPGNTRNVVRTVTEVPAAKLQQGIVLVDTPGLGSLARRGARETLAYLPSADLGALLIDAGSTLNDEDIATLRLLYEAGIPAFILLSKADLLAAEDIERAQSYIHSQLEEHLGVSPDIHPVSAKASHVVLLDRFYQSVLLRKFEHANSLRKESVMRKTGVLREAVAAAIETILNRNDQHGQSSAKLEELEANLRRSIGRIGEAPRIFENDLLQLEEGCDRILQKVSLLAFNLISFNGELSVSSRQIADWIQELVEQQIEAPIDQLRRTSEQAVDVLARIAEGLEATDAVSPSEVNMLFRNLPRFEMSGQPHFVVTSRWNLLGEKGRLTSIRSQLKKHMRTELQEELRVYGRTLHRWVQETTRQSQRLINSYADGYRVQMLRLAGSIDSSGDVEQLHRDLILLRSNQTDS